MDDPQQEQSAIPSKQTNANAARQKVTKTNEPHSIDTAAQLSLWSNDDVAPIEIAAIELPTVEVAPDIDPPWSARDIFSFIVFAFLSFIGANLAGMAAFYVLRYSFGWKSTLDQAFSQAYWVVGMQTGWELLWLLFIYNVVCRKYHRGFWKGLKWEKFSHPWAMFVAAGAAVAFLAQFIMNLVPSQKHLPIEKLFTSPSAGYLLAFFGICIAPFVEELVFRGFFYPVFEKIWGLWVAVFLTTFLFAAIHVPQLSGGWAEIASIFVVGAVFSYCRGKTGSLVPSFLMHLAYNSALFVSLYLTTDHFRNLKG